MGNISNRSNTMSLLEKASVQAKKHLGQNFIIDPSIVERIAAHSGPGEVCLEIGPGLGALTEQLAKTYDQVIAYEIDPEMEKILQESLQDYDNVQVILEDFLQADLSKYSSDLHVCANLPYYITTPILFRLMEIPSQQITVMVQKEIGERLNAEVGSKAYNALSIQMQFYYDIKKIMNVSPESFYPKPNVDSIVIQMKRKKQKLPYNEQDFFAFIKRAFVFPRKTLNNNLKNYDKSRNYLQVLESLGLDPKIRAEDMTIKNFIELYGALYDL